MGLFAFFMIINSIIFVNTTTLTSLGVLFIFIYLASYILPLISNVTHLRLGDFFKGILYCIYLAPTYINLITIYAMSNIHDVSWGSRATVDNPTFKATEKLRSILYRNYRSTFLILWVTINIIVGYGIQYLYIHGHVDFILYFGAFLMAIMILRVLLSFIHRVKAK